MAKTTRKSSAKASASKPPKGRIVAASASMVATSGMGASDYGRRIEEAMIKATEDAMAEGITDPKKILERKLKARQAVIDGEE